MRSVPSPLQRCLHALVALLALLSGTGALEALHGLETGRTGQPPTADFEAHDASCLHRGDAEVHDEHSCVVCKSGGAPHAALPAHSGPSEPLAARHLLPLAADAFALAAPIPGSIGARAPPVTAG